MSVTAHPTQTAIGICTAPLRTNSGEVQVFPAGTFRSTDTRPADAPHWYIDAEIAQRLIAQVTMRRTPLAIDYEHQTLLAKQNGQPAPAAGRFETLEWREGDGLYAIGIKWTERARQYIDSGEYQYFSPVFNYRPGSGEITGLLMGALTNAPGIDGMAAVQAAAAAHFTSPNQPNQQDMPMDETQLKLLGLAKDATAEQITAALTALTAKSTPYDKEQLTLLGLAEDATAEQVTAALTALKEKTKSSNESDQPDPAQFVPVAALTVLQTELAALQAQVAGSEIEGLVQAALRDGRLLPAMESWARDLGRTNLAALKGYLDNATPIAALTGSQTGGQAPSQDQSADLTPDEQAVCTAMGLSFDDYKAAKPKQTGGAQ